MSVSSVSIEFLPRVALVSLSQRRNCQFSCNCFSDKPCRGLTMICGATFRRLQRSPSRITCCHLTFLKALKENHYITFHVFHIRISAGFVKNRLNFIKNQNIAELETKCRTTKPLLRFEISRGGHTIFIFGFGCF